MKSCEYCGRDNDDASVYCARCGSSEWKELTTPSLPSRPAVQPAPVPSEPRFRKTRSITTILCRTSGEAALVADQLEQVDILPLLSDEPSETDPQHSAKDSSLRVLVSAKAFAAEKGLAESLNFRMDVHGAQDPLPLAMKLMALVSPRFCLSGCSFSCVRQHASETTVWCEDCASGSGGISLAGSSGARR